MTNEIRKESAPANPRFSLANCPDVRLAPSGVATMYVHEITEFDRLYRGEVTMALWHIEGIAHERKLAHLLQIQLNNFTGGIFIRFGEAQDPETKQKILELKRDSFRTLLKLNILYETPERNYVRIPPQPPAPPPL